MPFPDSEKEKIIFDDFGPKAMVEYDTDVTLDIAFHEVDIVDGQPVLRVLNGLVNIVEDVLLTTEARARQTGLIPQ